MTAIYVFCGLSIILLKMAENHPQDGRSNLSIDKKDPTDV